MSFTDEIVFENPMPIEVPVKIGSQEYILIEANGDAVVQWRNAQLRATRMDDGKVNAFEGMADTEPLLISLTLFQKIGPNRQPVALSTIRSWPNRIQKTLYDRVMEISGLNAKETKDSLTEKMADLKAKLKAMDNGKGDPIKNLSLVSTAGSS